MQFFSWIPCCLPKIQILRKKGEMGLSLLSLPHKESNILHTLQASLGGRLDCVNAYFHCKSCALGGGPEPRRLTTHCFHSLSLHCPQQF